MKAEETINPVFGILGRGALNTKNQELTKIQSLE
jgi:hypothetical protein